jgi:hypothetical protein
VILFMLRCGHVLKGFIFEKPGYRLYCEKCRKLVEIMVSEPVQGSQEKVHEKNSNVRSRNG